MSTKLNVYNTLINKVEEFKAMEEGTIGLYTCGPTVYDFAHIGNFRSYVFEDLVKRYLMYLGYNVRHIMNITDIDDKTIRKSNQLGITLNEVTNRYIQAFYEDIDRLNIVKADIYPRATEHIGEMIELIDRLDANGLVYTKGNSVYFSIDKFSDYGKLANISRENLQSGGGTDSDEYEKDNVQDFVLWKGKKEDEPSWDTKYGDGRPGWHLECSAMSMKYLGEQFDIHMGGVDNIFPHHENEIAQAEGATGKKFVNYWIHCQHLIVDNQKMSKSLGNFYTLRDLMERGYDPLAIRYLLLSAHYRKLLNFTFEGLDMAKQSLKRIGDFVFSLEGLNPEEGVTPELTELIRTNEAKFRSQMDDDFNISGSLGAFFDFIHEVNVRIKDLKKSDVENVLAYVKRIDSVIGVLKKEEAGLPDEEILKKIEERQDARKRKDFAAADAIRDQLKAKGIVLIDTPEGVRWKIEQ